MKVLHPCSKQHVDRLQQRNKLSISMIRILARNLYFPLEDPWESEGNNLNHFSCMFIKRPFHVLSSVRSYNFSPSCVFRCPCMWQQRWHQSADLHCLCHLLTPMLVLLFATLAMSRGAHHTGHTLLCGSSSLFYQSRLWIAHASACASRSARRGRLKMPRRKHNDDSYPCSLLRFSIFLHVEWTGTCSYCCYSFHFHG